MYILFRWEMPFELMKGNRIAMSLFKLEGLAKRVKQRRALLVEEPESLWAHLDEDTRTTSMVAAALGRASELHGLCREEKVYE
jgi:hypothetical protein